jgi:RimJ/RimL family protein N-acetyltransferase
MAVAGDIGAFETERLSLRPLVAQDTELLFDLNRDPEVMQFLTGRPSTHDEVEAEVASALGRRWVAFQRSDRAFIGWIGAVPSDAGTEVDIGWRLVRSAWGQGLATEAASALIDRLFERGARRVFAQTMAVNERSRRVMQRCGLRYCRTFHLTFEDPLPGTDQGEVEYELTRTDWQAARRRGTA